MKRVMLAALIAGVAGQAAALSCMEPDLIAAFETAAAADATYHVLYGTLDFDTAFLPDDRGNGGAAITPAPIPAFFRGHGLSRTGFNLRLDQSVTLQPYCAGPWCGMVTPHVPAIAFVRVDGDQLVLDVSPCGGQIFDQPQQADLDAMVQCINGNCPSTQPLQ
ncbi:MAG: hypothetical protein P8P56_00170 [Yoonia sp.]|nr:hypothetical protein [Yoonia sp.]